MLLKKIHISGFKSFADKITIPFDEGITGIVGPNGSGKSNVIDAVRWVMGEQNARNLRGKVATDIIFAGSESRKALGMAEVTLIFDNSKESTFCPPEYRHEPEISLTRRLYVDGQREYLINRKSCRYKDIVSFFSTTGLGGRSYSMIQQGQVDRILNAKPEDVRIILEEAAGTLVFKTRRDEALKKLDQTRENLSRIEDIVEELDRQQRSLESQMEKAKKWKEFTTELRSKELQVLSESFQSLNEKRRELQETINNHSATEAELLADLAKLEAEHQEIQQSLDTADPDLEGLREEVSTIREQIARAENMIFNCGERTERGKVRLEELTTEIDSDSSNLHVIEEQVAASTTEVNLAQNKAEELRQLIDSFQDQVDAVDEEAQAFQNRIEDYQDELRNVDRLLESNSLRCEAINREREKLVDEIRQAEERHATLSRDLSSTEEVVNEAEAKVAEKQAGLDEEVRHKNELEQALKARKDEIKQGLEERDSRREVYFTTRARITSLQELEETATDVASTVTELRQSDESFTALTAGLLTDFITFGETADELPPHARTCFEQWSERLLVEDLSGLNELVRLAHRCEVSSFPVSLLSDLESDNRDSIRSWAESCDAVPMHTFIKTTKDHPKLNNLLDRIYLLESVSLSAEDINRLPEGAIVFTAQGLCCSHRDEFVIGHSHESRGILSRKSEIEQLMTELKSVEADLAAGQAQVDQLETQQREDELKRSEIEERLQGQNSDVLEVLGDLQGAQQALAHKKDLLNSTNELLESSRTADQKLVSELAEHGEARLELGGEQERIKEELASLQEESGSIEEKRTEVFRQHEGRKLDLAKSEARAQALQQSFDQTRQQLDRIQEVLTRRYDEKSRIESDIEQAAADESRSKEEIEQLLSKRETKEAELTVKREENAAVLDSMKEVDGKLREIREKSQTEQSAINTKKLSLERVQMTLETVTAQAQERSKSPLTPSSLMKSSMPSITLKTFKSSNAKSTILAPST